MSEPRDPAPTAADLPLAYAGPTPSSPLVRLGGLLGIVGSLIGIIALLIACAGFGRALAASPLPIVLGVGGVILALFGALTQKRRIAEDTHVMQAAFAGLISLIGGLLEMAVWLRWPIFYK